MIKTLVILGSTREARLGEKVAKWFMEQVSGKYPEMEFELADLKELDLPWFDAPISPAYAERKYDDSKVTAWSKKVEESDAFVIITPEYNHGYSAPLKNAIDLLFPEWNHKPVAFVSYGGVGGARAVEQLRQVAVELHMASTRSGIHITKIWEALDDNGQPIDQTYNGQIPNFVEQLQWWANALKIARDNSK